MRLALTYVLAALASTCSAQGGKNTDAPVNWTIYAGYQAVTINTTIMQSCAPGPGCIPSAINGDGTAYVCGKSGVSNCVIHMTGTDPSYDATLLTSNTRPLSFDFGARVGVNNSVPQPSWDTQKISGGSFINVSHILYPTAALGSTLEDDYTTRFTSQLPVSGTAAYHLRMDSAIPAPDSPSPGYYGTFNYNDPYQTALVRVHHCPDTTTGANGLSPWCPAGHKESWYVYPDAGPQGAGTTQTLATTMLTPAQVGMLIGVTTKGNSSTTTALGQYSIPFFFKIELQ